MSDNIEKLEALTKSLSQKDRIIRLMLENIPSAAMIINRERIIVYANKTAIENGAIVGEQCWKTFGKMDFLTEESKVHLDENNCPIDNNVKCSFCQSDEAMADGVQRNNTRLVAWGDIWDTHWIPIKGTDLYLHYAYNVTKLVDEKTREELLSQPAPYGRGK